MINSNLGLVLHRLTAIHPWRTDRQTDWRTNDNHGKSSTVTYVRSANNTGRSCESAKQTTWCIYQPTSTERRLTTTVAESHGCLDTSPPKTHLCFCACVLVAMEPCKNRISRELIVLRFCQTQLVCISIFVLWPLHFDTRVRIIKTRLNDDDEEDEQQEIWVNVQETRESL